MGRYAKLCIATHSGSSHFRHEGPVRKKAEVERQRKLAVLVVLLIVIFPFMTLALT